METFSLIVCNYNNGDFFRKCFESIQRQTYNNFEVIIIDDCSTDNSREIIQQLIGDNPKFKFYTNDVNKGYAYTLHKGIMLATGKLIARLDPDDAIYENAIEESIKHFKSQNIIATYSQIRLCDNNLNPQNLYPRTRTIKNGDPMFFNINNEVSHFFTFRKEAYLQTEGINENLSSSVDFDLYLKLYEKGNFHYIKQPLYLYRQHPKGISQDKTKKDRIYKNWNKVLYDTCQRRKITKLYGNKLTEDLDLARIIFQNQNRFIDKLKRFISSKL
ncbi:MAG: glycosyltransferase family 2 protein [Weeksellaceae bacterium]|jgi:glycosyltransferase involved in cell wall biosynthesis|nr:glycosyltransferase family 2 protein [Weeksellaceae bacterium]MDX9705011.1 glycosyltransferase family 2 protein [Weeksellaceae bacterium]